MYVCLLCSLSRCRFFGSIHICVPIGEYVFFTKKNCASCALTWIKLNLLGMLEESGLFACVCLQKNARRSANKRVKFIPGFFPVYFWLLYWNKSKDFVYYWNVESQGLERWMLSCSNYYKEYSRILNNALRYSIQTYPFLFRLPITEDYELRKKQDNTKGCLN